MNHFWFDHARTHARAHTHTHTLNLLNIAIKKYIFMDTAEKDFHMYQEPI